MANKFITENGIQYTVEVLDNGSKFWCLNGKLHRKDYPAVEFFNGSKIWYRNGLIHREDGPAIEYADGDKAWYLNGKKLPITSSDQFFRLINLKAFL